MTRIIIIRHGQSEANQKDVFAGHSDFDLTALGRDQARAAAEYLYKTEKIDAIYSSDLKRAFHTASPISEIFSIPAVADIGLREMFAGKWESLTFTEIAENYPNDFAVWKSDYSKARPTGGESAAEVYRRIVPHITELARAYDGKTLLISTHATVLRAFTAYSMGYFAEESGKVPFSRNASINIFEYDQSTDTATAIARDLTDHLGDMVLNIHPLINA